MREFPSVAVMENRMLTAENEMDCFLNSPIQTGGHSNLSNVFDCVPVPVIFVERHYPAVASTLLRVILSYKQGIFRLNSNLRVKIS